MVTESNSLDLVGHQGVCEDAKILTEWVCRLREEIRSGRWAAVSEDDVSLANDAKVEVCATDDNGHVHRFVMQLLPEENFCLGYFHEAGDMVERSFVEYVSDYLAYSGFYSVMSRCGDGLSFAISINEAYDWMCRLMDIVLSRIKPLSWFYSDEPEINSFEEAYHYMASVCSLIRLESCRGRWHGIRPENIKLVKYDEEGEACIVLEYAVDGVWRITLYSNVAQCDGYQDLESVLYCSIDSRQPDAIRDQLDASFSDFLGTLKVAKGNTYIGCGQKDHSIQVKYFHIDDTFDVFCSMLDEVGPALHSYNFQIPTPQLPMTDGIADAKRQLESVLGNTFEVVSEEEEINKKLKNGRYLS